MRHVTAFLVRSGVAWALSGIVVLTAIVVIAGFRGQVAAVQTNSMRPIFSAGDALIVRHVPLDSLRIGDVITYRNPQNPITTVSHRIVAIQSKGYITQGDAQKIAGPLILRGAVAGKVVAVVPHLGTCINWIHSPAGLILGCYLPAVGFAVNELWRLFSALQRPQYRLRTHPNYR